MSNSKASVVATLLAGLMLGASSGAHAQLFNRPPGSVQNGGAYQGGVNDPAALLLRIERLENQIRSLTGQLEEAQFQNRRLEEQVRRQQEAGLAASDSAGRSGPPPQRRSDALDSVPGAGGPPPSAPARGRGDAFDPSQNPGAPGAPRVLGSFERPPGGPGSFERQSGLNGPLGDSIIDEGPYGADPSAPLDLLNPRRPQGRPAASAPQTLPEPATLPPIAEPARPPQRTQTAMPVDPALPAGVNTIAPPSPRELLDTSGAALRSGDLERAEAGFKEFLKRYPTSRLASEATFNLGDVYARRSRHREAAEQFLKVTTDFAKSSQAPQSLHRLGQSLERLGAKEQACAAWAEVPRKYPSAPQTVRAAAERDIKRASC